MSNENNSTNRPMRAQRYCWFALMLYTDNISHLTFVDTILNDLGLIWYGMLHDKDVYAQDIFDDDGYLLHKLGDPKKPHWHIVIHVQRAMTVSAMASNLLYYDIEENLVQSCDAFFYTRYITHVAYRHTSAVNFDKHYYPPSLIIGDRNAFFKNYNVLGNVEQTNEIMETFRYIEQTTGKYYSILDCLKVFEELGLQNIVLSNSAYMRILNDIVYNKRRKKNEISD